MLNHPLQEKELHVARSVISHTPTCRCAGTQTFMLEHTQCSYQWRTQEFCLGGGVQQIQLRTEDRENGDLGAVAP